MKKRAGVVVVLFLLTSLPCAYAATQLIQLSQDTPGDLAPPYRLRTSVASNGRGYVVAWEATADPQSAVRSIYIRVLGADGVPLRPSPTLLGLGREPRVVWNGHEYLAIWGIMATATGPLPAPSVMGVRLREDGSLIDAKPVTIVSEENPASSNITVEWNGSQYLVTWTRGIALVDADLQHSKIVGSVGGTPFYSAATAGGSFVVLSSIYDSIGGFSLYVVPFSASGNLGVVSQVKGFRGNIVPFQDGYVLIWDDETNLHYGQLSADGRMVSSMIIGPGRLGFPRLATRDFRLVASWEAFSDDTHTRVCTVRFETIFQPVCSAVSTTLQHDPAIATSSTSILVAWSERGNARDSVRVLRTPISEAPHVEAGLGRSVSDSSSTPAAERRADGSLAVAWSEYNSSTKHTEIHIGGKSGQSRLIDRAVFADDLDQTSPVIAAGVGRTMALWEEGPVQSPNIRMTIFNDATKAVIATLPLAAGSAPSVAFDGKEWLATWQSPSGVIRFALFNSDGNVIASGAMPAETPASSFQAAPAVAWSGKTFFVTWRETIASGSGLLPGERIEVATVNTSGVASASRTLDGADAGLAAPSVAANGSRLLVSWGTPSGTLRQTLFDDAGKQLSAFIDFAWPFPVSRTRTRAMPNGYAMFAVFAGSRIALTSSDGRALAAFDVPETAAGSDFAPDPDGRFVLVYSRAATITATFAETVGAPLALPRQHAVRR
jgi:hypothetical protein